MKDHDLKPSTRAAEGFFYGLKFSLIHSIVYSPFFSKSESLKNNTSFAKEYFKHMRVATLFYVGLLSSVFYLTSVINQNKEQMLY